MTQAANPECSITDRELVSYLQGEVGAHRTKFLDEHVPHCRACRERIGDFQPLSKSLAAVSPTLSQDQIASRKKILLERLEREEYSSQSSTVASRSWHHGFWRPALLVCVLVILLGAFIAPTGGWADFPLSRVVHFTREPFGQDIGSPIRDDRALDQPGFSTPELTVAAGDPVQFNPALLHTLPGDIRLVSTTFDSTQQVTLEYARQDGLQMLVVETLAGATTPQIQAEKYEYMVISGVDVLWLESHDLDSVSHLVWTYGDIVFNVLVLRETASGKLDLQLARLIVVALNTSIE